MNNTIYLIVLLLPEDLGQEVDMLRLSLAPLAFAKASAHLTIIPPFKVSKTEAELEGLIRAVFNQQRAYFPLRLQHEGLFEDFPSHEHLVLKVQPALGLTKVRRELLGSLQPVITELPRVQGFLPHITVSKCHDRVKREKQAEIIRHKLPPREFAANGIMLWQLVESQSPHYETVQLYTV